MSQLIIDIGDCKLSDSPGDLLVTYSLGSCVGVAIHDSQVKVGGIIHCMLPLASVDKSKAEARPFMFVDSGMMRFLKMLYDHGCTRKNMVVKVAGCAKILDNSNLFRIGERNYTVLRKILWKNGLMIESEQIGGSQSRTLKLEVGTGRCLLRSGGSESEF